MEPARSRLSAVAAAKCRDLYGEMLTGSPVRLRARRPDRFDINQNNKAIASAPRRRCGDYRFRRKAEF